MKCPSNESFYLATVSMRELSEIWQHSWTLLFDVGIIMKLFELGVSCTCHYHAVLWYVHTTIAPLANKLYSGEKSSYVLLCLTLDDFGILLFSGCRAWQTSLTDLVPSLTIRRVLPWRYIQDRPPRPLLWAFIKNYLDHHSISGVLFSCKSILTYINFPSEYCELTIWFPEVHLKPFSQ